MDKRLYTGGSATIPQSALHSASGTSAEASSFAVAAAASRSSAVTRSYSLPALQWWPYKALQELSPPSSCLSMVM